MATLVLEAVGSVVGQFVGGPIGAVVGQMAGAFGGAFLQSPNAPEARYRVGPRLSAVAGVSSMEGAPVPRVYGRARIGGQMIWATRFVEQANVTFTPGASGKASAPRTAPAFDISYSYFANVAIGLCEGPIAFVRRVWADGQELDLTTVTMRVYRGDERQESDPLIVATEAPGTVPAYRGLAYVVFDRLPLAGFGNRVPQFTFEVVRPVEGLGAMIRAVDIIPGATEFGYQPTLRMTFPGPGVSVKENRNQSWAASDWTASLDALQALCPNLESVALIVVWFGDDLRAGHCTIAPRVDLRNKMMWLAMGAGDWSVAGAPRAAARLVSQADGRAAYGGTPSDDSVIAAIRDLKARGLSVVFYPFVMMDIPAGNALPDPWSGAPGQPAYPWRGRIVCDPAPGRPASVDATAAAAAQIAAFFGSPAPGPSEWSYRRFVLHYADLCATAGGVDAFLVGSELVALTRVRAAPGLYPAAQALATLANDVKSLLGAATKISYAADWTEYGAHVVGDELRFPLDVVWGASAVDFVGIDAYWPLSDWRDGDHLDLGEADTVYDLDYLTRRFAAGEAYDWHYESGAARSAQTRSPIVDGAYGEHWTYRQKDIVGWWSHSHVERVGGVKRQESTAWTPCAKPVWLIETGCAAIDRGANAPNVFPDAKSSEGGAPYFSRGFRDDLMQARFLEATIRRFDPAHPDFDEAANPVSPLYGGRMVDPARIHFWAWDARPFPAFPQLGGLWADAENWRKGHWLNGRLEGAPLDFLLRELARGSGVDASTPRPDVEGFLDGYVLDRAMSSRAAIEQLSAIFSFDPIISGGAVRFARRSRRPVLTLGADDLVPFRDGTLVRLARAQESELPHELAITFCDSENDYETATVLSRRLEGRSLRRAESSTALITRRDLAQAQADVALEDLWASRETAEFQTSPALCALEPGDVVELDANGARRALLVRRIAEGAARHVVARAIDPAVFDRAPPDYPLRARPRPRTPGPPLVVLLDLAIARGAPAATQYIAACADPWPGPLAVMRKSGATLEPLLTLAAQATIGETLDELPPGPAARFDRGAGLTIRLHSGALASVSDTQALDGRSVMAIRGPDGAWELFAFVHAELVAPSTYRLSRLVRGLGGEEHLARRAVPAGAAVVLMDKAVSPLSAGLSSVGADQTLRVGPVGADLADISFVEVRSCPTPKAFMPYAPVGVRARRVANGIEISFTRRGRIDSDAWSAAEIPVGEDVESYEIAIARPAGGQRVIAAQAPFALYADADVALDFPAPPAVLYLTIRQVSASVGAGFPLIATAEIQ